MCKQAKTVERKRKQPQASAIKRKQGRTGKRKQAWASIQEPASKGEQTRGRCKQVGASRRKQWRKQTEASASKRKQALDSAGKQAQANKRKQASHAQPRNPSTPPP